MNRLYLKMPSSVFIEHFSFCSAGGPKFWITLYRIVGCSSRCAQLPTTFNLRLPHWLNKWDELFECDFQPKASGPDCKKTCSQRHPIVIPNDQWTGCRYQARNPELSRYTKPTCLNLHGSPLEISCIWDFESLLWANQAKVLKSTCKIHYKSAILRIFEILKASDTGQKISFQKNSKTPTDFTLKEARNPEFSGMCMHTPYKWAILAPKGGFWIKISPYRTNF